MIKNEIIDEYYNEAGELSGELTHRADYPILNSDNDYTNIHAIIEHIINYHKNGKVGLVNGLEGGLAIDYTDIDNKKECRFILGFTELGYWIYCNTAKENLK